jgi:hypothetical protein
MGGIGEGFDEEPFNTSNWGETGGFCSASGNDGFDDDIGADAFVTFVWECDFVFLLVVGDAGEVGLGYFEVAEALLPADGAFEERARTWFSIFELAGITFGGDGLIEDFMGAGSVSEIASGGVVDGVLEATVGVFVLPVFFWAAIEVIAASSTVAIGNFDASLDVVGREAEAFVDFWLIPFLAGSILSAAIDSDTTFFGLPLFFTTSADMFLRRVVRRIQISLTNEEFGVARKIVSRVTAGATRCKDYGTTSEQWQLAVEVRFNINDLQVIWWSIERNRILESDIRTWKYSIAVLCNSALTTRN